MFALHVQILLILKSATIPCSERTGKYESSTIRKTVMRTSAVAVPADTNRARARVRF